MKATDDQMNEINHAMTILLKLMKQSGLSPTVWYTALGVSMMHLYEHNGNSYEDFIKSSNELFEFYKEHWGKDIK